MAHEVLRKAGFKPTQIKLVMNDTTLPDSGPAGGSRSNVFSGNDTRVPYREALANMWKSG
jgi:aldehyde oxidoreductase